MVCLLVVGSLGATFLIFNQVQPPRDGINFFVFGDSQGYQGGLEQIAVIANQVKPDFVFHCGDLTPFGQEAQYLAVESALSQFQVPVYATAGNHDIRSGGNLRYADHFGAATYSFDIWQAHITVFNTSGADISESEFLWLENDLSQSELPYKLVFTHIPPFDPRPEQDHTLTNLTTANRLMTLFEDYNVNTVFTGHIHMYNQTVRNGVRYVVTGGAGASLYASPEAGGIYHFVNVTLNEYGMTVEPIILENPTLPRDTVAVRGKAEDVTLSLTDLQSYPYIEGFSSLQNQYDNWRGQGTYRGVTLSYLVELVGGILPNDTIRVESFDGYVQEFCYANVYPNSSWFDHQGTILLAYQMNGTLVPDWADGLRLVMMPDDGAYSNEDCLLTSAPGCGCDSYLSAGARWVRFVSIIEVVTG